ncbi:MAG: DUF222 domain-containing protein [Actinomycetota bacterium]
MAVAEIQDLSEAMAIALKVDFAACTPGDRRSAIRELGRLESQFLALQAEVVGQFEQRKDWAGYGHRSPAVGIREISKVPMRQARHAVATARSLRGMPLTSAALADGSLSTAHAMRLRAAARRAAFTEGEALLVEQAGTLRWADWLKAVAYWEQLADDDGSVGPDTDEPDAALHTSVDFDGTGRIDGRLDPIGFEAFDEALRRIERELFDQEWRETRDRVGPDAVAADLPRTSAQRRAAALVEMAHRATTAPKDGKRPLPLVVIHTDPDTFNRELAHVLDTETPEPLGTERLCETATGTIVTPSAMIRAALHGEIRRLVYSSPSHVLDYGRSVRLFQGALRQAIIHAARRCQADGCEVPASRCEIDHVVEWADHGVTAAHNGQPFCRADHRHKPKPEPG